MAVLRKRVTKEGFVYDVDFYFQGQRHVKSTRTSDFRVAKRIRNDIQAKIALGTFNLDAYGNKGKLLSEFFEEYFKYAKSFKKERTLENDRHIAKRFIEFAGDVSLRHMSNAKLLDQWQVGLRARVNPTTFNIHRRFLHAAFNVAIRWKHLDKNPMAGVKKAKPVEKRLYLTPDEIEKIFALIKQDMPTLRVHRHKRFLERFALFLLFILNTGLRRNEALGLTPKDVDLNRNVIHIHESKTNSTRLVPLNATARSVLMKAGEKLFSGLHPNHLSRKFASYLKRAGLVGFKLHSCRHTYATELISRGVDLYTVSRLLGHTDIRTSQIYAKANIGVLQSAVEKLDGDANGKILVDFSVEQAKGLLS